MFFIKEFFFLLPELFLLVSSVLLMIIYPITIRGFNVAFQNKLQTIHFNAVFEYKTFLIMIYVATIWLLLLTINSINEPILLFQQQYFLSSTTQLCKCFVLITIIILLLIAPYQSQFTYWEEHIILTIFIVISGMFMISANDYLILWLAAEFQSFCFIIGISFFRNGERALEGGNYYFVTSALMSGFFLLGIWLIYGVTGTINLSTLSLLMTRDFVLQDYPIIQLGALFILSYFLFKMALVPLHIWSLHVFTTSNLFIVYQLAIISKLSGIMPLFQTIAIYLSRHAFWFFFCIIISLLSIIIGAFGAFKEDNIKRFLAYSSINHFGWILLPLALNDLLSIQISFFYFLIYITLNVTFFVLLFYTIPHNTEDTYLSINNFGTISTLNNTLLYSYLVVLFSFIGMPPLLGFFGKIFVFVLFIKHGFILMPLFLIPLTAISAYYYIAIIIVILTNQDIETATPMQHSRFKLYFIIALTVIQVVGILYLPKILMLITFF